MRKMNRLAMAFAPIGLAIATPAAAQVEVDIVGGISAPMPIAVPAT